jgi:hypothetical protein
MEEGFDFAARAVRAAESLMLHRASGNPRFLLL